MLHRIFTSLLFLTSFTSLIAQPFIQRQGQKLFYQGNEIHLRGMAFGNLVWDDNFTPDQHHTEQDFKRIKSLGMNAIRFYMNYKTFETDASPFQYKASGWEWIDQNIEWAKNNGIFLILNMHVPQGGFQSQCNGNALWNVPANQDRLAALWKAIAERYKNESQIAGFDILNEPNPAVTIQSWSVLAQRIIDSIRSVDQNHLIITERAIALNCNYGYSDANNNYPQITEENLMYTVHLYDPFEFTHQNLIWSNTGDGGKYPDENLVTAPADAAYATGDYNNPSIASGTTDWTLVTGSPFRVREDSIILGRVVFVANGLNTGKVFYDDFTVSETDPAGNVRTLFSERLSAPSTFWKYSSDETGIHADEAIGHGDNYSVSVTGNAAAYSVICPVFSFKAVKGHSYSITGWMKGENVPVGASANITTEYYYSPSNGKVGARNAEFLRDKIISSSKYIVDKGFPVYFGEFGTARKTFENNKGGAQWVTDALNVFDSLGYHFTYHSYKEESFGYYDGWNGPVDTTTENTQLTTVFKNFFGIETSISKEEINSTEQVNLYPNPASEILNISLNENQEIERVDIVDLMGQLVMQSRGGKIEIEQLPKGSYLARINTGTGVYYRKFVKN